MKLRNHILLLFTMVVWAGSFVFIKIGLRELDAFNLAFYRFVLASPLLLIFVYLRGKLGKVDVNDLPRIAVLGLAGVALLYAVQFVALEYTTATNASILINTAVVFVALISFAMGERLSAMKAAGVAISFLGIVLIVSKGKLEFFTSKTFVGDMLMIFDGFLWAIYTILGKNMLEKYNAEMLTAYTFVAGTVLLFPFAAFSGFANPVNVSLQTVVALLYLSILCSVFAYLVWYEALSSEDSVSVSAYIYLVPLFTAIIAYFVLDEVPDIYTVVGGAATLFGVYMTVTSTPNTS